MNWIEAMMADQTILTDDEKLITAGEAAVDAYNASRERSRQQIIPMARGLLAARRRYPSNREFGDWLHTSAYRELGDDDRAALIKIGENEDYAAKVIRITRLASPQTIWDTILELRPSSYDTKTTTPSKPEAESQQTTTPDQQNATSGVSEASKSSQDKSAKAEKPKAVGPHHPFAGRPRAAEVAAIYGEVNTRTYIGSLLGKRGGRDIWDMILQSIDAGLLRPNKASIAAASFRLLFPDAPIAFARTLLLTDEASRNKVREQILPAAIRLREEILAAPERIAEILQRDAAFTRERTEAETKSRKIATALQGLGPGENEVVLYGRHFWPIIDIEDPEQRYDFGQLVTAAWSFNEALTIARGRPDNSPKSCGNTIRHLFKRLAQANDSRPAGEPARAYWRQIYGLINRLSYLHEQSHDKEIGNLMPWQPLDKASALE